MSTLTQIACVCTRFCANPGLVNLHNDIDRTHINPVQVQTQDLPGKVWFVSTDLYCVDTAIIVSTENHNLALYCVYSLCTNYTCLQYYRRHFCREKFRPKSTKLYKVHQNSPMTHVYASTYMYFY